MSIDYSMLMLEQQLKENMYCKYFLTKGKLLVEIAGTVTLQEFALALLIAQLNFSKPRNVLS